MQWPATSSTSANTCHSAEVGSVTSVHNHHGEEDVHDTYALMDINTIINGKEGVFAGLLPMVQVYVDTMNVDVETRCKVAQYLSLVSKRARGELQTMAGYMRSFVRAHPKYQKDSVVSEEINYDLITHLRDVEEGRVKAPALLGDLYHPVPRE
eukprot:Colp12_sorted_trinity150504_noHs@6818